MGKPIIRSTITYRRLLLALIHMPFKPIHTRELIPQEPASVLLERIRAEKEQLIKDKKSKYC